MATYTAPMREINFVLGDVLNVGRLASEIPAFAEATPDVILGLAEEAAKLIEGQIAPLNHAGDQIGCKVKDGVVTVPPGFAEAYKLYS
ncbi:MAG: acyl-CoA dehydrogenase N-terminal domain-containing protein, partial [Panacagrimonas sp.]